MEREVIVVGAGPAGATAAIGLARAGVDVLLLDRASFPRDKICGDAVPAGAMQILRDYGMGDKLDGLITQRDIWEAKSMRLVAPSGRDVFTELIENEHGTASYVCPRIHFDNALYEHAVDQGAAFQVGKVQAPLLENGRVIGVKAKIGSSTEEIRSKVVIAADGVASTIARQVRSAQDKHKKYHRAIALRAYVEDMEMIPHTVEFFLYREILPGYAWIFPTGDRSANIGLGMRVDKFEKTDEKLPQMLDRFMEFPEIKKRTTTSTKIRDIATWPLNFGSQRIQRAFDGAMLIGDAGGYINPLTGGGIHNALISGQHAANVAIDSLKSGDFSRGALERYETLCDNDMWNSMNRAYQMQRSLMNFPFLIDLLVRVMGRNSAFTKMFLEKL